MTEGDRMARLPRSLEAERSVLGSMLRDNGTIPDVLQLLRAEDFATYAHQLVFAAIAALFEDGSPADLVTAADRLHQQGHTADVPYELLADLLEAAPTSANAVYYARIVLETALRRGLVVAGMEIAKEAQGSAGALDEVLAVADRRIQALFQAKANAVDRIVPIGRALQEARDRYDQRAAGPGASAEIGVVMTGWADLDTITAGLQPTDLITIGARTSVGKTSLALGLTRNAILAGVPVLFVSLEMSRVQLAERLLCGHAAVDLHRFRLGRMSAEERDRIAEANHRLAPLPLFVDDTAGQSISRIAASARSYRQRHGIGLLVVDYLQLVEPENRRDPRHEQVGRISRRLKQLAKELQIPVVAPAQLGRAAEDRDRPRLSDFRESGEIEQDADVAILMHRPEPEPGKVDVIELLIKKQRNGPTGTVELVFRKESAHFENYLPDFPAGRKG
jgi:replicative DNA helicase